MSINSLDEKSFATSVLNKKGTTIVDFSSEWCGTCKILGKALEELSPKYSSINVFKVDVDSNMGLAMKYKVGSVPFIVVFKDGVPVDQMTGFSGKGSLESLFTKYA